MGKRLVAVVLTVFLAPASFAGPIHEVDPWAGLGSLVVPGLGQGFQKRFGHAAAHTTLWMGTGVGAASLADEPDYLDLDQRTDDKRQIIYYNRTTYYSDLLSTVSFDTQLFSAYDAFYRGQGQSAQELFTAPFRPTYFKRLTTWIPIAVRAALIFDSGENDWAIVTDDSIGAGEIAAGNTVRYGAVAVGEEALFRGVANEQLTRYWGSFWGVAASSALFGLAHSGEAGSADTAAAAGFGAYLGWLHVRNDYDLGEGVAIHFWWNFLTGIDYLRNGQKKDNTRFPVLQIGGRF